MLFQVGGQGTRPTFFEMAAAQQLPDSLKAALHYSLEVFGFRRPFRRVVQYEDEFFTLLMLILETHSLRTTDASFSESLYGLRRRAVDFGTLKEDFKLDSDQIRLSGLRKRQRVLSVAFLVAVPYLKSKLHFLYRKVMVARAQRDLNDRNNVNRHDDISQDESEIYERDVTHYGSDEESENYLNQNFEVEVFGRDVSNVTCFRKALMTIIAACYPWLHATGEGLSFAYQLLYLLDATGFYTPGLHVLGIHVCRATGQELMDSSSRISKIRRHERERLRGPPWIKGLQRILLNCMYTTLDYAQTGLIAAVFFFKMMEWWYQSAEERMSAPTVYPTPPPPPPPKAAQDGIPLPPDRTICPLCLQKREKPAVITVSGFVFCHNCVNKYISKYNRCPVTLLPATGEHIRIIHS